MYSKALRVYLSPKAPSVEYSATSISSNYPPVPGYGSTATVSAVCKIAPSYSSIPTCPLQTMGIAPCQVVLPAPTNTKPLIHYLILQKHLFLTCPIMRRLEIIASPIAATKPLLAAAKILQITRAVTTPSPFINPQFQMIATKISHLLR